MEWISVLDRLPELGDYSVLAYFNNGKTFDDGGMDMVHVEDYFKPITAGTGLKSEQLYTHWYLFQKVTHWAKLPEPPKL